MKLGWSETEEQAQPPQARDTIRSCGQLLGRLDALLPCLYIVQYGATVRDLCERISAAATGLFAVLQPYAASLIQAARVHMLT